MANYSISHNLSNLSVGGGRTTLTLSADSGYVLPDSITVTNGTLISWDKTTGVAVIEGDDTTTISCVCESTAPAFTQVYPTRVGDWEFYSENAYTRLSNMNTSKIYSVRIGTEGQDMDVYKLQYSNGNWMFTFLFTNDPFGYRDWYPTIHFQTQTSVDFFESNTYFVGEQPIVILEGDIAVSDFSDFSGYTATNDYSEYKCLSQGTQITLADYTTKNIEDITFDDNLLVWDFYEGKLSSAKPIWIKKEEVATHYRETTLEDGTILKTVGKFHLGHRVYNVSKQQMIYDSESVGDNVYKQDGSISKIVSSNVVKQDNKFYNIITEKHYNLFANGILTSCRLSNRYGINNMKYDLSDIRMTEKEVKEYLNKLD